VADMYAWSPVRAGGETDTVVDPLGRERRIIKSRKIIGVGEKVSAADLTEGNEDEFQAYVDSGAVRPYPYPEDCPPDEAPVEYLRRRIREAAEAEVSEEQQLLMAAGMGAAISEEELVATQPAPAKEETKPTAPASA
jgi:hypothetical protein